MPAQGFDSGFYTNAKHSIPGVGLLLHPFPFASTSGMPPCDPLVPLRTQGLNHDCAAVTEAGVLRRRYKVSARNVARNLQL